MATTIRNIKATELPPNLLEKFNVEPHQLLTVTVKVEEGVEEEYDMENLGDALVESFEQIKAYKEGKLKLSNARDLLESL